MTAKEKRALKLEAARQTGIYLASPGETAGPKEWAQWCRERGGPCITAIVRPRYASIEVETAGTVFHIDSEAAERVWSIIAAEGARHARMNQYGTNYVWIGGVPVDRLDDVIDIFKAGLIPVPALCGLFGEDLPSCGS